MNVIVLGISRDYVDTLTRFTKEYGVEFKLLSDKDGKVTREYGVMGLMSLADRVTFIVNSESNIAK